MSDDALPSLIAGLYELLPQPAGWQGWLDRLCDALAAAAGVLVVRFEPDVGDQGIFAAGLPAPTSASSPARATYLDYLREDARLFQKALVHPEGEQLHLSEVLADDEFAATRFYREWLRPHGLHHVLCLIVCRSPRSITGLSLLRRRGQAAFDGAEADLLGRLLPHLQRVVHLQERLVDAELKAEVSHVVLESLHCGALLVDASARVCGGNERAARLLARGAGVRIEGAELRADDARESAALRRLVRTAAGAGGVPAGGVLALARAGRRHALVVSASPLRPEPSRAPWLPAARALVLLSDPEDLPALHEPALRALYGFTDAEARTAARLAQGGTVGEIAASLGVRRTTVRTHLQQALEKTGTHRQAELVRLLLMAHGSLH